MTRKIDALVAEHVMGLDHIPTLPRDPMWLHLPWLHLPHYSTDIAAAWEVVEKLTEKEGIGRVEIEKYFNMNPELQAKYLRKLDYIYFAKFGDFESIIADTAPMAICLAALKAKGVEVE